MSPQALLITPALVKSLLPQRPAIGHKGCFGTALIFAGSRHFTGAAYLAGAGALRAGVGLLHLAVPASLHPALAGALPEAIWELLPEDEQGYLSPAAAEKLAELAERKSALLIGPGLGQGPGSTALLNSFLQQKQRPPAVLDADALRLLARVPAWSKLLAPGSVLTPHAGEMAALCGETVPEDETDRQILALKFATVHGVTLVLKGAYTLIATAQGNLYQSDLASSALAHGGSGDVLAGLLTGLLAQGMQPAAAAICAVWLHGQAALLALREEAWEAAVLPSDLLKTIGQAAQKALSS